VDFGQHSRANPKGNSISIDKRPADLNLLSLIDLINPVPPAFPSTFIFISSKLNITTLKHITAYNRGHVE